MLSTNSEDIVEIKRVGSSIEELMENNEPIKLNVKHRRLIFILMGLVYCFSSSDGGIIPQQNKNIQYNFEDKGEARVGLFSSIDYVGRIMGAGVMSVLIDRLDRQIFFSGCCILKAITLFVSTITENYYINLISRLISGIPQTLLTCYGTIWTDQFGRRKRRLWNNMDRSIWSKKKEIINVITFSTFFFIGNNSWIWYRNDL